MKRKKAVLAVSIIGLILALLCVPIPIQTKIVEGKACPPPPVRHVLKIGLFNVSFYARNITMEITIDGANYTFLCDKAHYTVRMWRTSNNVTVAKVFVCLTNCYGEGGGFRFYVGQLFLNFEAEFSEDYKACTVYCYAKSWVPIIVIIYNLVVNCAQTN